MFSLFSDGTSTVAENVRMARRRGLRRICLVDHVHSDTEWVVRFALAVHAVRAVPGIEVLSGLEATLLDRTGRLDVPDIVLRQLADAASAAGALVEVNERRGCPSPRTLRAFTSAGVRLVAASGSQDADGIGRYDSVAGTFRELGHLPS